MQNRRKSVTERRTAERREKNKDARPDSEKGIVGDRRSGEERRGTDDRRQQDKGQQAWF